MNGESEKNADSAAAGDAQPAAGAVVKTAKQLANEAKKLEKLEKFNAKKDKVPLQAAPAKEKAAEDKTKVKKEENEDDFKLDPEHEDGTKKNTAYRFPPSYRREYVEAQWYDWWEKEGFFKPEYMEKLHPEEKEKFVIVIPPPNVTGTLHLGHALTNSVEDTLTRWHRMCGKPTLWVPGCDHAGIATQVVVEKRLAKERPGFTRHDLGREKFMEEIWKWKNKNGDFIYNQIRRLGSSVDWSRVRFTMEPVMSKAVTEAFVRLHADGTIYRSKRLINWSCTLKSCISDIEVEKKELTGRTFLSVPGYANKIEFGVLTSFAYPIENSTEEIVVATTRVETMLGDTGIAVHPDDERYKGLIGKFAVHPFLDRRLPIVADKEVDKTFGTGAVKITPAHDHNDYAIGQRHNLDVITILKEDGTLRENCGATYSGMKRFDARKVITDALREKQLFRGTVANPMVVPMCSRSKDVVEPLLMAQWFVDCKDMAAQALDAVESKRLRLIPDVHNKTWNHWLVNIHDWCISRQLWWGHRIPAYLVSFKDKPPADNTDHEIWISGRTVEEVKEAASKRFGVPLGEISLLVEKEAKTATAIGLFQDEDVLDTWFSSALFPFSVFAWPDESSDLEKYYPTSLLETGADIIFFWVARMVMMGLKLTGKLPFAEVYLHSIVRDRDGRKMSKSLGNVIDPVDVIEGISLEALHQQLLTGNLDATEVEKATKGQKEFFPDGIPECGTDALRFGLCACLKQVGDINLDINVLQGYRFFCNKLWNALRFAMLHSLGSDFKPLARFSAAELSLSPVDQWILSRAASAVKDSDDSFREYDLARMTRACYSFWLYDLCDIYLECCKAVFTGDDENAKEAAKQTLYTALDIGLRLISPVMPFISEELFQRLPRRNPSSDPPSICVTQYPLPATYQPWINQDLEGRIELMMKIVNGVRSLRADYNFKKSEKVPLTLSCRGEDVLASLKPLEVYIRTLTNSSEVGVVLESAAVSSSAGGSAVLPIGDKCTIILSLKNIDATKELERLTDKLEKLTLVVEKLRKGMASYSEKVPEEVRLRDAEKLQQQLVEKSKIEEVMATLSKLL